MRDDVLVDRAITSITWRGVPDPPPLEALERESAMRAVALLRRRGLLDTSTATELETGPLETAKRDLVLLKQRVGSDRLLAGLAPDIEESDRRFRTWTAAPSDDVLGAAVVTLGVRGLKIGDFLMWLTPHMRNDGKLLLPASPEHYIIRIVPSLVVETMGGLPVRLQIELHGQSRSPIPADPSFQYRMIGTATLADRTSVAHIAHDFRDTPDGCEIKLAVHYAPGVPDDVVRGHQAHLTVEWAYTVEQALAGAPARSPLARRAVVSAARFSTRLPIDRLMGLMPAARSSR